MPQSMSLSLDTWRHRTRPCGGVRWCCWPRVVTRGWGESWPGPTYNSFTTRLKIVVWVLRFYTAVRGTLVLGYQQLLGVVVFDLESLVHLPFLDQLHPPLIIVLLLSWLIVLILILFFLSHFLILSWWKMMVDLVLVKALRALVGTHLQWTCSLARCMEPLHHLIHQDQLALLASH
jgi:hypothetical protein